MQDIVPELTAKFTVLTIQGIYKHAEIKQDFWNRFSWERARNQHFEQSNLYGLTLFYTYLSL